MAVKCQQCADSILFLKPIIKKIMFAFLAITFLFAMVACGDDSGGSIVVRSDSVLQQIFDGLKDAKTPDAHPTSPSTPTVIGLGSISTEYRYAMVDKFINGYTARDNHHINMYDWTGVEEGIIKLSWHGFNGDGDELWTFITLQDGEHYLIYAWKEISGGAFSRPPGIWDYPGHEGQVWVFKWY